MTLPADVVPMKAKLVLILFALPFSAGGLRVIASIEAPAVIDRILAHLGREAGAVDSAHSSRAPPGPDRLI